MRWSGLEIDAWVLSGAGGGLPMTVMLRTDPLNFLQTVETAVGVPNQLEPFDTHPLLTLIGTLAEPTDPLIYGPMWFSEDALEPTSVLLYEGIHDAQTPSVTAEALAVSAGLPQLDAYQQNDVAGLALRGLDVQDIPVGGNIAHPPGEDVTGALAQFDSNHFAIFREFAAGMLWADWIEDSYRNGAPGRLGAAP